MNMGTTRDLLGKQLGNIRLVDVLGSGGMGAVYAGHDEKLQRRVAVKAIRNEFRLDQNAKARFLREARILSTLDHPNICIVHDFFEGEDCDYLVLELVEGVSLREAMANGLGEEQKLAIAGQLLDVLVAVHGQGVVHRDLKPENIMVTPEHKVKVLDFGLARSFDGAVTGFDDRISEMPGVVSEVETTSDALAEETATIAAVGPEASGAEATMVVGDRPPVERTSAAVTKTTAGTVIGTAGYMSPEQARGEPASAASDIYSLGLILQELFTGKPAMEKGIGRQGLLVRAAMARTLPVEGLGQDLTRLIERMKALEPAHRPSSVDAADRIRWIGDAPRRRRRRRVRLVAWLILALFSTVMAVQAYRLSQSRKRERLASRFGAEVQRIESLMRFAHMMPLHDLAADKARVRERMEWVREHMDDMGSWGRGPGMYAIGRGHLALGEVDAAREALEMSWENGYQEPPAAYALGLSLGRIYQRELARVRSISDPDDQQIERERIEVELRDPATSLLRRSSADDEVAPEYVEGLLALHEERFEDSLTLARKCRKAVDWYYECLLLEGEAWNLLAYERRTRGEGEAAQQAFERSDAAYRESIAIAGSDPRGYAGICKVWTMVLTRRLYDVGGDLQSVMERAVEACNQSLTADPQQPEVLACKSNCYRVLAEAKLRADEDPAEALELAKNTARQLVELEPEKMRSHHTEGIIYFFSAATSVMRGQDGRADAEAAVASLQRAASLEPNDPGTQLDLGNAHQWCGEAIEAQGGDPMQEFEKAAAGFRRATELKPTYAEAFNNLAYITMRVAQTSFENGEDPRDGLREAIRLCDRALELKPDHMFAVANRAIAHLRLAQYEVSVDEDPTASFEAAMDGLDAAVALHPDHPPNYLYIAEAARDWARVLKDEGRPTDAIVARGLRASKEALTRVPEWPPMVALDAELRAIGP